MSKRYFLGKHRSHEPGIPFSELQRIVGLNKIRKAIPDLGSGFFIERNSPYFEFVYDEPKIKVPRFEESAGFYTTEKRSRIMSHIRAKNSKPEILLRKALWHKNVRFRINTSKLPGRPDISIQKYRLAVFIDGEFWHGYNWDERRSEIKSNRRFWIPKIERNMQRDREVNYKLMEQGYTVMRFWAKELKNDLDRCVRDILKHIETFPNQYE